MNKIISINKIEPYYGHLLKMINIDSKILRELFGEPLTFDHGKSDYEWILKFDNGSIITIYDWKCGKNYNGEFGLDLDEMLIWHIGGKNKDKPVVDMLVNFLSSEDWGCFEDIRKKMIIDIKGV